MGRSGQVGLISKTPVPSTGHTKCGVCDWCEFTKDENHTGRRVAGEVTGERDQEAKRTNRRKEMEMVKYW